MVDLIQRRAAVAIQRRWRLGAGLKTRFALLAHLCAAARRVSTSKLYLDAWVFYLLLRQPKLPPVPPRLRAMFPEFRGSPAVDGGGRAVFLCLDEDVRQAFQVRPLARLEMLSLAMQVLTSRHTNPFPTCTSPRCALWPAWKCVV